jgi:predicted RNA-binding protein with RPS1 domain
MPAREARPLLDADRLAAELGTQGHVYTIPTGDLTWELTARLPPRLDVYGGAVRLFWPGVDESADPFDHRLFLIYDRGSSDRVISQILDEVAKRFPDVRALPPPGSEMPAVVTRVLRSGVELTLSDDTLAYAAAAHVSPFGLEPNRVVRPGQAVRVRVAPPIEGSRRVPVSLLAFQPDSWTRFLEVYDEGELIEGVVRELRNIGALVEVLPGFRALVPKAQISREWVSHPEDFLDEDERLVARVLRIDRDERRATLSLLDPSVKRTSRRWGTRRRSCSLRPSTRNSRRRSTRGTNC